MHRVVAVTWVLAGVVTPCWLAPRVGAQVGAPEAAAAKLELHAGFELSLVAAEPLVVDPLALDWDARGRLWVALGHGHPGEAESPGTPGHASIVILGDKDGDRRMDERQVFAEGLERVSSFVFREDGVIVTGAAEILWLRDLDGDDRSDERVVLYAGFGRGDSHALLGNLRPGLDGWIYGTLDHGADGSRQVTDIHGVERGAIGDGIFRFQPDGSAIESVVSGMAHTSGLDFSWDGELFFGLANGSHLRHVVLADRELAAGRVDACASWVDVTDHGGAFPLRGDEQPARTPPDSAAGFTAASGACLYTGGAWSEDFDGDHFLCEPALALVHHDSLAPRGVTYRATKERSAEFLASTDSGFRPVYPRVGPDGALYVLDSGAVVPVESRGPSDGPDPAAAAGGRESGQGRIWRIQQSSALALEATPLAQEEGGLIAELAHPNLWRRMSAQRLLCERATDAKVMETLADRALNAYRPCTRVHALWILARRAPLRLAGIAVGLLRDPEPAVRKNALRAFSTLQSWELARALERPAELLAEPDARTALDGLVAMRTVLPGAGYPALLARYGTLEDPWSRSAVLAIAAENPARFLAAALGAPPDEALLELTRSLCAGLAQRGALKEAVEIVTLLGERGESSSVLCAAAVNEFAQHLAPELVPWPSPRIDRALVQLLSGSSLEAAVAASPLSERWSKDRRVSEARKALEKRLAEKR